MLYTVTANIVNLGSVLCLEYHEKEKKLLPPPPLPLLPLSSPAKTPPPQQTASHSEDQPFVEE